MQVTGSILQPNISGNIKLSHGEAYLPHDKGSAVAPFNKLGSAESRLPSGVVSRMGASRYVSRFFSSETGVSETKYSQPSGNMLLFGVNFWLLNFFYSNKGLKYLW